MVTVRLYGTLAEQFGAEHRFDIATPVEAIRALDANHPGFRREFVKAERYYLRADGDWRDGDEAAAMPVSRELDIVPAVEGDAFAAGLLLTAIFPALTGVTIFGVSAATLLGGLLITGLLVGVTFLLSPKAKKSTEEKKTDSFAFAGPDNVVGQGSAVPLVYGRCFVGSVVVSAGLETGEEAILR